MKMTYFMNGPERRAAPARVQDALVQPLVLRADLQQLQGGARHQADWEYGAT